MCDMSMMKRLAKLSGFNLSDSELAQFCTDMTQILTLMDEISAADIGSAASKDSGHAPLRADEITNTQADGVSYTVPSKRGKS